MELNAQEGEEAPWRAVLKDSLLTMEKEYTEILCCTPLVEHNLFSMKRWNKLESGETCKWSHIFLPTQANNK